MPYDIVNNEVQPVFEAINGWKESLSGIHAESQFPKELKAYLSYLEAHLQVPVTIVSVGPDRNQTIIRKRF
jgi:adenylosuccinate synthase